MATSSCRLLIPGSSTDLHVQLLWCHGAGTRSGVGALDFPGHRFSLRNGVDHLVWTTLPCIPILSGLSVVLPLPSLLIPPSLCVGTPSEYLGATPPLTLMAVTPSRAWIAKRLGWSKVMSALSPLPLPWLECQDRASDLFIELPGRWWSVKLNQDRCRDH